MKQLTFAVLVIISAISCKKETTQYSATGLWYGNIYVAHCAVMNRPDGSCRLFEEVPVYDTAMANIKLDGTWKITGNRYRAEYYEGSVLSIVFEADLIASDRMTGRMVSSSYSFELNMMKKP